MPRRSSNFFEDVLSSDVEEVEFDTIVSTVFNRHLLDLIVDTLSHHVVVVELLVDNLLDELGFTGGGFTCYNNS